MKTKRIFAGIAAMCLMAVGMTACGQKSDEGTNASGTNGFDTSKEITVVSRDSASGTRSAFHEIMGITVKEGDTEKDMLVTGSLEFDSTDKVITAVEGDPCGIGYVSMGSLSDRIAAFNIDSVAPTPDNVKNGSYKISRPFLMVTGQNVNDLTADFISFCMSSQGQEIVKEKSYIEGSEATQEYTPSGKSGTIKITGSTSVEPLMQKLIESYKELNPNVTFEMQCQGSSQGIKDATAGTCDIGLSSRQLKDSEKAGLKSNTLALDGIAVIKNKENTIANLTSKAVTDIYKGTITSWNAAQ